jgi:hypothetical protein
LSAAVAQFSPERESLTERLIAMTAQRKARKKKHAPRKRRKKKSPRLRKGSQ